ncbi:hypothetical protein M2650_08685 [Luteimonas sp. SX5]|uniref:Secreted protein n=1 Tax=Luteimonas galliterrae TaxID=2940486 RepID=A0ABT0MJ49_9GAMM|nr:hypothetical protein [Luteimonas galliterrae]MCL1634703.1 hypothetical protein [Luteimonas galliterrae]
MVRLCLALLLICACAAVSARDVRMQTPNGETGTCPEPETSVAAAPKTAPASTPARGAKPASKPASAANTTQGGGGEAAVRSQGPRWHSFLPGMFR